jgi:hypothetical protein
MVGCALFLCASLYDRHIGNAGSVGALARFVSVARGTMAEIIRSGAFLQQCWSVHPLCLTVKRIEPERIVVLTCSSCRMVHRVTTAVIIRQASAVDSISSEPGPAQPDGLLALTRCLGAHAPALSLREMDVFQDAVWVRCAECRAQYDLTVSQFETHQK